MANKCLLDQSGNFYSVEVYGKNNYFTFEVKEGTYQVTDKHLVIYGLFEKIGSEAELVDKDKQPIKAPTDKPIKLTFLLETETLTFKDKETGQERKWEKLSLPEFALIAPTLKSQGIEPGQPFTGSICYGFNDAFQQALQTREFKGVARSDEWFNEQIRLNYIDAYPIEKLSFDLPDLTATNGKKTWNSAPKQSELDRLNDRLQFLKTQFVDDKPVKSIDDLIRIGFEIGVFVSDEPDYVRELKFDFVKLIMM